MDNNRKNKSLVERRQIGMHLGGDSKQVSPEMKPYVVGHRRGKSIIDREATSSQRGRRISRVVHLILNGERIMVVATEPSISRMVDEIFREVPQVSVVSHRWIAGTLTNRETRATRAAEMRRKEVEAPYEISTVERKRYDLHFRSMEPWLLTPLEQVPTMTDEEIKSRSGGQENVKKIVLPGRVFFFNPNDLEVGVREAKLSGVTTSGRVPTTCRSGLMKDLTYPIPSNDRRVPVHYLMAMRLRDAVGYGVNRRNPVDPKDETGDANKNE